MGIDVWEVIAAAKTKLFGFMAFYPGPGLRRALHPDRSILSNLEGQRVRTRRASLNWRARSIPPCPTTSCIASPEALNDRAKAVKGSRILILGLAYKPNVDDERESPSYRLLEKLK